MVIIDGGELVDRAAGLCPGGTDGFTQDIRCSEQPSCPLRLSVGPGSTRQPLQREGDTPPVTDLNHRHLAELLAERESLTISRQTLRRILVAAWLSGPFLPL